MKNALIIGFLAVLAASPARSAEHAPSAEHAESVSLPFDRVYTVYGIDGPARDFLVELHFGQTLTVSFTDGTKVGAPFAVSVYRVAETGSRMKPEKTAGGTANGTFRFEPSSSGPFVIRLGETELEGGKAVLAIDARPVLTFPIAGKKYTRLVSLFGDGRDEGARFHEGVDIKAPRSTPVVAAADGIVRKAGKTASGGNVISLWDPVRRLYYYYAHLETQDVAQGKSVKAGERLGTVGNSGNASATFPHLHFSVYTERWKAIDPLYFVYPPSEASL